MEQEKNKLVRLKIQRQKRVISAHVLNLRKESQIPLAENKKTTPVPAKQEKNLPAQAQKRNKILEKFFAPLAQTKNYKIKQKKSLLFSFKKFHSSLKKHFLINPRRLSLSISLATFFSFLVFFIFASYVSAQIIFNQIKFTQLDLAEKAQELKSNLASNSFVNLWDLQKNFLSLSNKFKQLNEILNQEKFPYLFLPPFQEAKKLSKKSEEILNQTALLLEEVNELNFSQNPAQNLQNISSLIPELFDKTKKWQDLSLAQKILQKNPELKNFLSLIFENEAQIKTITEILPQAFGYKNKMRYLLIFQNPNELRPTGGFMGSFAYLEIQNGKIVSWSLPGGGTYDLQGQLLAQVRSPKPLWLINPRFEFQDLNWFPDFPTSAKLITKMYEKTGNSSVDGVIALNGTFVAEILDILGPLEFQNKILQKDNFLEELQNIIEQEKSKGSRTPKASLSQIFPLLLEKISLVEPEKKLALTAELFQALIEKDIQIYFQNQNLEEKVCSLNWCGDLKEAPQDFLFLVSTNIGGQKTDGAIEQEIKKETTISQEGKIINKVTIIRRHQGDPKNFWTRKRNVSYLRLYVPKGSKLLDAWGSTPPSSFLFEKPNENLSYSPEVRQVEMTSRPGPNQTEIFEESGKTVFSAWQILDPGEEKEIVFIYELPTTLNLANTQFYSLLVQKQSGRQNDKFYEKYIFKNSSKVIEHQTTLSHDRFFVLPLN